MLAAALKPAFALLRQLSSGSIEFYELKFKTTSKALFHRNRPSSLHKRARPGTATGEAPK